MKTLTATDLARHTRQALDAVVGQGETIAIERNQVVVARLVPAEPEQTAARALANFAPLLAAGDGQAWLKDSRDAFGEAPRDPWA